MSAEQNSGQELPEELKAIEAALRQLRRQEHDRSRPADLSSGTG